MVEFLPNNIREYYNLYTKSYIRNYGDIIQAFRPSDNEELLDYIARSAGINWKLKILDMGCGIGGPAIYFAKKWNIELDGVTISDVQYEISNQNLKKENLFNKVKVYDMDFHYLDNNIIKDEQYDIVLFLESLGHSNNIVMALMQAYKKLKKGGTLYIKDFYFKKSVDEDETRVFSKIIKNINANYFYNTLELDIVKKNLQDLNFQIEFIRPFNFKDDITCRSKFEKENGIDIFEGQKVNPADWLEIKCIKN
jgi:cyclopropane fatty-acyl-phospholipid synthase-like methyltransferase